MKHILITFLVVGFLAVPVYSQYIIADDEASNYSSWTSGSNEGFGYGNWSFNTTGSGGQYIGGTGLGASTFGVFAGGGSGNSSTVTRTISNQIGVGTSITIQFGYTDVSDGGEIGFSFFSSGNYRLNCKFVGGQTNWVLNDGGTDFSTTIPFDKSSPPLIFTLTRGVGDNYSIEIQQNGVTYNANDFTATSGSLAIDRLDIYSNAQGGGENFGFDFIVVEAQNPLEINSTSDVVINGNVSLATDDILTVNNFEIPSGNTFTINSSASGSGSLIINGNITNNGTVTVQRYIEAYTTGTDGWHQLASPVEQFSIAGSSFEPGGSDDFFSWNESAAFWYNYEQSQGPNDIIPGEGYLVAYSSTETKTFSGNVNNEDITLNDLSYTANEFQGWHLLGNPFPCALLWDATSWNLTNVDGTAKIWDEGNASYLDVSKNDYIPSMQGFMIRVNNSTNSITIPKTDRAHNTALWYKNEELNKLKLTVYDLEGNTAQQSILRFDENATAGFDSEFDSYYLSGYAPQFYSAIDEKPVSTNTLPELNEELQIPFYFVKNDASSYRLEVEGIESLELDAPVYITDNKTGQTINISETGNYEFEAMEGDDISRFMLHFKSTGFVEPIIAQPIITLQNQQLSISDIEPGKVDLRIIDIMGRVVAAESLVTVDGRIELPINLNSGVYILEINTNYHIFARKISVN